MDAWIDRSGLTRYIYILTYLLSSPLQVDINAGGIDLKFPHHENQMAQVLNNIETI